MKLDEIHIYRISHVENIPHILKNGITHRNSPNSNKDYITIGDISLIDTRESKIVTINNGIKNFQGAKQIVLGEYIPFYFGARMPMLYVIKMGGNFVERATPPEDIIYLKCSLISIVNSNTEYYFSDGHATDKFTTFYDNTMINDLPNIIDWNSINAFFWGGDDNLNIKRKKQAEFLVSNDVPEECIILFGCYNEKAKDKLLSMGIDEQKIKIGSSAYY